MTRAKDNMSYRVCRSKPGGASGKVLRDDLVTLKVVNSKQQYPQKFRRVEMLVEVDGKEVVMAFITNNFEWSAASIGELYQARWGIEVFFKQIKQTLKVRDFLGHSKKAVRWQLWSALLLYVLLRNCAQLSDWAHSFTRLSTIIRGTLRDRISLTDLLNDHGTAGARCECERRRRPRIYRDFRHETMGQPQDRTLLNRQL